MPNPTDAKGTGAPTGVAAIKSVVENANAEDENRKDDGDDDAGDAGSDDNGSGADNSDEEDIPDEEEDDDASAGKDGDDPDADKDDDSDDDSGDPKDKTGKAARRFTQFAGDGKTETYISNLEKGYQETSAEGIRLNQELKQAQSRVDSIMKIAASDPDVAAKINEGLKGTGDGSDSDADGKGTVNPFLSDAQARWTEKSDAEIEKFIEANPEVVSDPKIAEDVKHYMSVLSNDHLARTGKLMTGGEAMEAAYRTLGLENKLTKQALAQGAKKLAAPTRPQGGKKKSSSASPKRTFTFAQIDMARKMGKADPQAWLEKNA